MRPSAISSSTLALIGARFGPDKQLQVMGLIPCYNITKALVKCHTCAKNPEVFGDSLFITTLRCVQRNSQPCGCNKKYSYKQAQCLVLVQQKCDRKGIEFLGIEGDFKGCHTILKLKCKFDGNEWLTPWRGFNRRRTCLKCARRVATEKTMYAHDKAVSKFMQTGSFVEGTTFRRSDDISIKRAIWYVTCPVCTGGQQEFESSYARLALGNRPCLCKGRSGFSVKNDAVFYVLQVTSETCDFVGYGITGLLETRLKNHRRHLLRESYEISEVVTFALAGSQAMELEREIKRRFPLFKQGVTGFRREATYGWLFDDVAAFAEKFIDQRVSEAPQYNP